MTIIDEQSLSDSERSDLLDLRMSNKDAMCETDSDMLLYVMESNISHGIAINKVFFMICVVAAGWYFYFSSIV